MALLRKSQAALEFIMTYGWAILVVLVAIGALSYFGVLSPDRFLPSKCTLQAGIACVDHKAEDFGAGNSEVSITIRNSVGYDMSNIIMRASSCTSASSTYPLLRNGEDPKSFTASGCTFTGRKYSGQVNVTYTNAATRITRIAQGSITVRVE